MLNFGNEHYFKEKSRLMNIILQKLIVDKEGEWNNTVFNDNKKYISGKRPIV